MIKVLSAIDKATRQFEIFVLSCGIMLMAVNTIANVFARYLFYNSIYFSEELNEFLIIIITFVGLGYATREGRHIRMSAIYDMLPPRSQKLLMIFISGLTAATMILLAWYGLEYVQKVARREQVTPVLQVPLYLVYLWVVVGFVVTAIQYTLTAIRNLDLSDPCVYISYTKEDTYENPDIFDAIEKAAENIPMHTPAKETGDKR